MPLKKFNYSKVKKPNARMLEQAKKMSIAKQEMIKSKELGNRHILELEAEATMYKHAMNLAEEMWKHYNSIHPKSKKRKKEISKSKEMAEFDFKNYSAKYDCLKRTIQKTF